MSNGNRQNSHAAPHRELGKITFAVPHAWLSQLTIPFESSSLGWMSRSLYSFALLSHNRLGICRLKKQIHVGTQQVNYQENY
jgi:hypothetical protein